MVLYVYNYGGIFVGGAIAGMLLSRYLRNRSKKSIKDDTKSSKVLELEKKLDKEIIVIKHISATKGWLSKIFGSDDEEEYIDQKTWMRIAKQIEDLPKDKEIGIILHTPGGCLISTYQIVRAIKRHTGKVTAYIPYQAFSGGSLIALACNEIVMSSWANLGPIDPVMSTWVGGFAIEDVLKVVNSDDMFIARLWQSESKKVKQSHVNFLKKWIPNVVDTQICDGSIPHGTPLWSDDLEQMDLVISNEIPDGIADII